MIIHVTDFGSYGVPLVPDVLLKTVLNYHSGFFYFPLARLQNAPLTKYPGSLTPEWRLSISILSSHFPYKRHKDVTIGISPLLSAICSGPSGTVQSVLTLQWNMIDRLPSRNTTYVFQVCFYIAAFHLTVEYPLTELSLCWIATISKCLFI